MLAQVAGGLFWIGSCMNLLDNDETALIFGFGALLVQCVLALVFSKLPVKGPWSAVPGFTAHQLITLPLYAYVAFVGCEVYFSDDARATKHASGFYGVQKRCLEPNAIGGFLGKVTAGTMLLWDLPTAAVVKSLRDPPVMVHHFLMAGLALLSLRPLMQYYIVFFFGVIETSSVPLQLVDFFHPRQVEWNAFAKRHKVVDSLNTAVRLTFAGLYVLFRMVLFPAVMLPGVLLDALSLLKSHGRPSSAGMALPSPTTLYVIIVAASVLTLLQLYWGVLIVRQGMKLLDKKSSSGEGEKADSKAE